MPQQKHAIARPVKRRNVVIISLIVVVSLTTLGVIGKLIVNDISKRQAIEAQKTTLNQTLRDMTVLYDRFVVANATLEKNTSSEPENRCSEISSKGTAKSYTCGTRVDVTYASQSREEFEDINNKVREQIQASGSSFGLDRIYPAEYFSYDNSITSTINFTHNTTGQACSVASRYRIDLNATRLLFRCNLNTNQPIFELED